MELKPGDVVILKSGGHPVTVAEVHDQAIVCLWMGEEGDLFRETLPLAVLEMARINDLQTRMKATKRTKPKTTMRKAISSKARLRKGPPCDADGFQHPAASQRLHSL